MLGWVAFSAGAPIWFRDQIGLRFWDYVLWWDLRQQLLRSWLFRFQGQSKAAASVHAASSVSVWLASECPVPGQGLPQETRPPEAPWWQRSSGDGKLGPSLGGVCVAGFTSGLSDFPAVAGRHFCLGSGHTAAPRALVCVLLAQPQPQGLPVAPGFPWGGARGPTSRCSRSFLGWGCNRSEASAFGAPVLSDLRHGVLPGTAFPLLPPVPLALAVPSGILGQLP